MARSTLKCPKCKRTFSMAAHLARHMNTIHGRKRGPQRRAGRKPGGARRGRPRGPRTTGAARTEMALFSPAGPWADGSSRVIGAMQTYHSQLLAQRASLDTQIEAFSRAIETLAGGVPTASPQRRGRKGRPSTFGHRAGSLKDYITRVLRQASRPMSPNEIGISVKRAGYKTKSKDLTKAVSNTLPDLKAVRKVGFGQYSMG